MAVSVANVVAGSSESDANSYATASYTPSANKLLIATVWNNVPGAGGASTNTPTLSGNSLTWVQIDTNLFADSNARITQFRAMGASPSTGTVTIDFAGQTQARIGWIIDEFTGMDTSGTNGSGAIVQSADNSSANQAALTVTLSAFGSANNATYGSAGAIQGGVTNITAGSGFTEVVETGGNPIFLRIQSQFKATNDTSVDWTSDGNATQGINGIAVEIKAATAGATTNGSFLLNFI